MAPPTRPPPDRFEPAGHEGASRKRPAVPSGGRQDGGSASLCTALFTRFPKSVRSCDPSPLARRTASFVGSPLKRISGTAHDPATDSGLGDCGLPRTRDPLRIGFGDFLHVSASAWSVRSEHRLGVAGHSVASAGSAIGDRPMGIGFPDMGPANQPLDRTGPTARRCPGAGTTRTVAVPPSASGLAAQRRSVLCDPEPLWSRLSD